MAKLFEFITLFVLNLYFLCSNIPILHAYHLCSYDQSLSLLNFKDTLQIDTFKQRCISYDGFPSHEEATMNVVLSSYCDGHNNPIMESKINSWNGSTDCCSWEGVTCNEFTGKVVELDLSSSRITGVIDSNSSIFQLSHLKRLNLAYNTLDGSEISTVLRRFTHLSHLNLSGSWFQGEIPSEISQLNELVSLDLSWNYDLSLKPRVFKALLQNMTRLTELSLRWLTINSFLPNNLSSSLIIIDLAFTSVKGKFPYHIFDLQNLQQLSLGVNPFDGFINLSSVKLNASSSLEKLELFELDLSKGLPNTIGNLKHLTYLDLMNCGIKGTLPQSFGNLSQLSHLDLYGNHFSGQVLQEIVGLEHLTWLDIGGNNLDVLTPHSASNNLKGLKSLSLENNRLTASSVSSFLRNLTQLETIDLSSNPLYQIPHSIFDLLLLQCIILQETHLQGQFPKSFSKLVNLRYLNVGFNNFSGPFETTILSNLVNLKFIYLESNNFSGPFETTELSNLIHLTYINLASNNFSGIIDVKFLRSLKGMDELDLSSNSLTLINEDRTSFPLIPIVTLSLGSCNIRDLDVLRSIVVLDQLYLPNNNIHGKIPEWVWSNWSNITFLDLSNNFLTHIGDKVPLQSLEYLNLESNLLQGLLPILPYSIDALSLANNQFHGEIKSSICELRGPPFLDLSNNSLSGALPHCISLMPLDFLDLHMNKLQGTIPDMNHFLESLNLGANHFEGELPRSLMNCSNLEFLDLSENNLNDSFPVWLGALPTLRVLSLRSNNFYGSIYSPHDSPNDFSQLQILDLSYNRLSGNLSTRLLQKFRGMMRVQKIPLNYVGQGAYGTSNGLLQIDYADSMIMVLNGNTIEVEKISYAWIIIDLSCNHFEGEIPNSIGGLLGIQRLNLSHNKFTGQIPPQIGNLSNLLTLDLSSNQLVGNIPDQFAALGFLAVMNLSYNHLSGRIPSGQQLRTFQNESYIGNDALCGYPLSRNCVNDNSSLLQSPQIGLPNEEGDQESFDGFTWQPVLVGYGAGICVGFVIGSLMLFNEKPVWLIRILKDEANKWIYKYKSRKAISQIWFKRS